MLPSVLVLLIWFFNLCVYVSVYIYIFIYILYKNTHPIHLLSPLREHMMASVASEIPGHNNHSVSKVTEGQSVFLLL